MALRDIFIAQIRQLSKLGVTQKTIGARIGMGPSRMSRLLNAGARKDAGRLDRKAAAKQTAGQPTASEIHEFRRFLQELQSQLSALETELDAAWRGRDGPDGASSAQRRAG